MPRYSLVLLLLLAACEPYAWAGDPSYSNNNYCFSVKVPKHVSIVRSDPPNPNHGFLIELHGGRQIWVMAEYNVDEQSAEQLGMRSIGAITDGKKWQPEATTLATLKAVKILSKSGNKSFFVVSANSHSGEINYEFGLMTDSEHRSADMTLLESLLRSFTIWDCRALSATGVAKASGGPTVMEQIKDSIAKARSNKSLDARTEAAKHLANLTKRISSKEVTETLVTDLIRLLDSPDDSVRYWVAIALGNLGQRAKAAVPKLRKMLPRADCMNGTITSADGIRYALIKMGTQPPPPPKCERIAG